MQHFTEAGVDRLERAATQAVQANEIYKMARGIVEEYFDGQGWAGGRLNLKIERIFKHFGKPVPALPRRMQAVECARLITSKGFIATPSQASTKPSAKTKAEALAFYDSPEWRIARMAALTRHGRRCLSCGVTSAEARIVVDHIKALRTHWHLRLEPTNLQPLCHDCNRGKGRRQLDFRGASC